MTKDLNVALYEIGFEVHDETDELTKEFMALYQRLEHCIKLSDETRFFGPHKDRQCNFEPETLISFAEWSSGIPFWAEGADTHCNYEKSADGIKYYFTWFC